MVVAGATAGVTTVVDGLSHAESTRAAERVVKIIEYLIVLYLCG
jgi:hypothetical protein